MAEESPADEIAPANEAGGGDTPIPAKPSPAPAATDLRSEMLREEIRVLESIERWGASLFLTAIALIARQTVEWTFFPSECPASPAHLHWTINMAPALVGLVAFGFLRTANYRIRGLRDKLNYRIRRLRDKLYQLPSADKKSKKPSCGSVGWWMASMPLLFGYMASAYLSWPNPDAWPVFLYFIAFAVGFVCIWILVFWWSNQTRKTPCQSDDASSRQSSMPSS